MPFIDILAALAIVFALMGTRRRRAPTLLPAVTPVLAVLVATTLTKVGLSITFDLGLLSRDWIIALQDYVDIALPLCWFFLFFALLQQQGRAELARVNEHLRTTLIQLRDAQDQLIHDERMKAMSAMSSGITHDFNNRLMVIQGFTELLLRPGHDLQDESSTRQSLEAIQQAARQAGTLVRRLRFLISPVRPGEHGGPVDVVSVIRKSVQLTEPVWRNQAMSRGCDIQVRVQGAPLVMIQGVESDLLDACNNLILNAVTAMPRGGELTFDVATHGSQVFIDVRDTGEGMSPEVVARCFEPAYSTQGAGAGLGLALVDGIVRAHGGRISVESEPGRGSQFRLVLPLQDGASAAGPLDAAQPAPLRILLVDDDARVRDVIAQLLAAEGHAVLTAGGAMEALNLLDAEPLDAVITDQAMPGINGLELARRIKSLQPQLPVVLLTGFAQVMEEGTLNSHEVDVLLGKPVSRLGLRSALIQVTTRSAPEVRPF